MFEFIKLVGLLFFGFFIVLYLVLGMAFHVDDDVSMTISFIASAILSILIPTLLQASDTKCPKCGKSFGMKEISRESAGSRATTMDVERTVRNSKGEVIRRYTEAVPATQYFFDCVDECKFCGHRQNVRREATKRD